MLVVVAGCCCWSLLLVAVAGCCCWSLLLVPAVDCCCWLLLLFAAAGCCCWLLLLVAAAGCWMIAHSWPESLRMFPGFLWFAIKDNSADEEVFEYFQDIVDLRPGQFCRRKSLWIFSGFWWFAAKTILQAKMSLNFFGCWWFDFEYFRVVDEKSLNIFGLLMKILWIIPDYWWEGSGRQFRLGEVG